MNNNKLEEAALLASCKGVFAKSSYITVGSKEKPEEYDKKVVQRSNFGGKQLGTAPPKEGFAGAATNDVFFEKKHNWISDGDKYNDRLRYKDLQPDKKKGFLTSDFSKRDEFSNTIRTEQWREQLSAEGKHSAKALEVFSQAAGITNTFQTSKSYDAVTLYDLIHEKDDPKFDGASKTHRDTRNPTQLGKNRAFGTLSTTSLIAFTAPTEFHKPDYARKPIVRSTFYRKTNIMFPDKCCATTGQD